MSVRRPSRAVGAPSPRLDAVLRAGQARLGAPAGAPAANPERADDPALVRPKRVQQPPGQWKGEDPSPLMEFGDDMWVHILKQIDDVDVCDEIDMICTAVRTDERTMSLCKDTTYDFTSTLASSDAVNFLHSNLVL